MTETSPSGTSPSINPKELLLPEFSTKNVVAGSLVLWKILAVYCMGVFCIARLPWFLVPVGWALVAAAYTGCLYVGLDCSRSCFFENKAANEFIGALVLLPLLRSVESLRRSKDDTSAWLSRAWACLRTTMSEKRNGICISLVILAALTCCWFKGFVYLVKYWLVPFLYMHLSVGSFNSKSHESSSYLALFPDVKQWAQMEHGLLETIQKAQEYIPVYNVPLMHEYLQKQLPAIPRPSFSPAAMMPRLLLLRGKRDAILAIAAVLSAVAFKSAGALGLAGLCLGYCAYSVHVEARRRGWLGNINWPQAIYITGCHVIALGGLWVLPACKWQTLLFAFWLWPISGFGITGGAHRLWSHRSYEAGLPYRAVVMVMNALANQGTIYRWSRDHRVHHMTSETEADPHNAKRGFFFAHMGWLYLHKDPKVAEAGSKMNFDDLLADPVVKFQHVLDPWFNMFVCFIFPALVSWYFWDETPLNGYLVAGMLRYVWVLHGTWCVNSLAHLLGDRPYDPKINPAENFLVSILSIGEGWHNWHHAYPYDYAASEFGVLSQFNPTKLAIDLAAAMGLVWGRKRATGVWKATQQRRVRDHLRQLEESSKEMAKEAEAETAKETPEASAEPEAAVKALDATKTPQERIASLTIRELRQAIPAHCFKRSTYLSLAHLAYDIVMLVGAAALAVYAAPYLGAWMVLGWPLYWWYQGLNGTALWVLAHECGHQGFSDHRMLNDAVGFVLHSFFLTPYFSWAFTHAKHHRRTNHMTEGETWVPAATTNPNKPKIQWYKSHPGTLFRIAITWVIGWYAYLFNNETGAAKNRGQSHFNPSSKALFRPADRPYVLASNAGMVAMLAVLAGAVLRYGLGWVLLVYAVPQMITNIYLVSITFMQHTHPELPHMDFPEWNWLNGALCTIDRSMGPWVDAKLHHICDSHVVHHLFSDMPFYGAKEATPYIAKYLEKYGPGVYNSYPNTYLGFWKDFYWNMKESLVVVKEGDAEVYRFK